MSATFGPLSASRSWGFADSESPDNQKNQRSPAPSKGLVPPGSRRRLKPQYGLQFDIPGLADRHLRPRLEDTEMAVFFVRVDARDLLDVEDIAAMRTNKLG